MVFNTVTKPHQAFSKPSNHDRSPPRSGPVIITRANKLTDEKEMTERTTRKTHSRSIGGSVGEFGARFRDHARGKLRTSRPTMIERVGLPPPWRVAGEGVSAIKHSIAPSGREGERGMRDDVCLLKRLTTADKKLGAHPSIRPSGCLRPCFPSIP